MAKAPFILLVNPWITDFAAYDLWAKPLGLLLLASLLRQGGCGIAFVDCLNRFDPLTMQHPEVQPGVERKYGAGKYPKMAVPKPAVYAEMPRKYYRHGIHPESFDRQLRSLPKPDLIWVTSIMTYWYPGVQQTVAKIREIFADVPVWLGGIYARLCSTHAVANSGADEVIVDPTSKLPDKIAAATGFELRNKTCWSSLHTTPSAALDLVPKLTYAPLLTSSGCPFSCPYCASRLLQPVWERRSSSDICSDIRRWNEELGVQDFAFYDDALLIGAETTLKPALKQICKDGLTLRFHTPNALHIRALTPEWCQLLHASGLTTLRLGLETSIAEQQEKWGGKVETRMFYAALDNLDAAGFCRSRIGAYLLCGLPGQTPEDVSDAIEVVRDSGAQPFLAEYSPIPGTHMWAEACALSSYPLADEPLYHNNSFFACRRPDFSYRDLVSLKDLARQVRCDKFQRAEGGASCSRN
ncbi:MAG: B12-binding domain-containing radical SAM protein [Desulforhabdus sp.]|jgi:radical SAM superfamily enzyme YgiQ (UPF0313 family)|nr:B12-binding domain-containing radical SAM protein [Desulforhabdus sp.]